MRKRMFLLSLFILIMLTQSICNAQTFKMIDDFETHNWHPYGWGSDIGTLQYSTNWSTEGNHSLKLTTQYMGTSWYIFGTGCFDTEYPDSIKMDLYAVNGHRLEVKGVTSGNSEQLLAAKSMNGSSQYLNWKINTAGKNIRKLYLLQAWYSSTVTVYIDNIRFYKNGVETLWDGFEQPAYYWDGSADADNKDFEVNYSDDITHSYASPNFNSTAAQTINWYKDVYLPDSVAQLTMTFNETQNWSDYYYFRLDVYRPSTTPDCSLFVFVWDGENGTGTDWKSVPANQWTTITMKLGRNIDLSSIQEIKIVIPNTNIFTQGKLYIDNLQVGGFTPINGCVETASIGVKYSIDDFDGRVPHPTIKDSVVNMGYNDYFGYTGGAKSEFASLDVGLSNIENGDPARSEPFAWKIEYDVDYNEHTWISYWNLLGPGPNPPPRDLSEMDKLSIWIKGDVNAGYSNRITLELHDDQWGNPEYNSGKAFAILSGISNEWKQWIIPLDPDSLDVWGTFDPTKITEFVVSLDQSTASETTGKFYIDDVQFIDTDEVYWNDVDFDEDFLDLVSRRTFNYFVESANDATGLVLDRATFLDLATVAGTGFGLAALVIGTERGWITRSDAEEIIENVLTNLWETPQGEGVSGTNGYKGFYYHFLESETGVRKQAPAGRDPVELSVVDTGILMAGVLLVREYFDENPSIVDLADKLYRRVEWPWFYNEQNNLFYLGWSPEGGFVGKWDVFTDEIMLINILAVASPTYPVPSNCFYAWMRDAGEYNNHTLINSWNASLFQYFFTHCWFDLHGKTDAQGINWWNNSIQAGLANRDYCIAGVDASGRTNVPTYSANSWGLTACEHVPAGTDTLYFGENGALPNWKKDVDTYYFGSYEGEDNGTVPPYGAGSMIGFAAYENGFNSSYVYDALKNYYKNTQLWTGNFGFRDCYTDTAEVKEGAYSKFPMYKNNFFSIDQGPMLMMIENYRSKLIWEYLGQNEYIQHAMNELFVPDFRVNDDLTHTTQLSPATDANRVGQYVSVWSDWREDDKSYIYAQKFHTVSDLGLFRVDGVNLPVTSSDTTAYEPRVAINGNGDYMITWFENNNVKAQIFGFDDSTSLTSKFNVNSTPVYSNKMKSAVSASENGDFVVTWTGIDDGKDIFVQRISSTGSLLGTNIKVNSGGDAYDQYDSDIAISDNGNFIITWTDNRNGLNTTEIYVQRYDNLGNAVGTNTKISGTLSNSIKPAIDMNSQGKFVIAWIDTSYQQRNVYAAKFNSDGSQDGGIITVSGSTYGPAVCKPDVALDSSGVFIVVWQDSRGGSMDIYLQKYNSGGIAIGGNTRAHSSRIESSQINPSITFVGNNGGYQIIWQDDRNGDWDIYCPVGDPNPAQITELENDLNNVLPTEYSLSQNYPNPFNPATTIEFTLPKASDVQLVIYDILGRQVATIVNEFRDAGKYRVMFDASDFASGIYIYRIVAGGYMQSKKMSLIK